MWFIWGKRWTLLPHRHLICIHSSFLDTCLGTPGQVQLQFISCAKAGMTWRVHSGALLVFKYTLDVHKQAMLGLANTPPSEEIQKSGVFQRRDQPRPGQSRAELQAVPLLTHAIRVDLQGKWIQKIPNSLLSQADFTGWFFLMLLLCPLRYLAYLF